MKTNELKCTDLRIGNYALFHNVRYKIVEIERDRVVIEYHNGETDYCYIYYIEPIELTEELLVNIGFEGEMYEFCLHTKDANIIVNLIENRVEISYFGNGYPELLIKYNVKYLHQLQNALYLLTNEELEVES